MVCYLHTSIEKHFTVEVTEQRILRLTGGQFWIGISDIISENRWIYSSDIQPVRVKDFHSGEPNGLNKANCVALWKDFHGYWADEDCHQHYNFVCEKSA